MTAPNNPRSVASSPTYPADESLPQAAEVPAAGPRVYILFRFDFSKPGARPSPWHTGNRLG